MKVVFDLPKKCKDCDKTATKVLIKQGFFGNSEITFLCFKCLKDREEKEKKDVW